MKGFVRFLSYNNAVPIGISLVTLSFGAAFAASDDARASIYASESRTVSVDNTYIANKDLSSYLPRAEIAAVTEDGENFYVQYRLTTIDVVDAVWQDVTKDATMRVAKGILGDTIDLGLYVTDELGEVVSAELERLRETQALERRQVTTRTIATEYSGLIGKFLDPTIEELPGYVPLVMPPAPAQAAAVGTPASQPAGTSSSGAPVLTLLGENPARVLRDGIYRDLGVTVSDTPTSALPVRAYVDGGPERTVGSIVLDTSFDRVWHIRYEATDGDGNVGWTERYVLVGDAQMPGTPEPITPEPATTVPAATTTAQDAMTPLDPSESATTPVTDTGTSTTGTSAL